MNKDFYTINDIQTLDFVTAVRSRIAMYLGSADMQGVYNAIQEIISNSIDEFYMGFGKEIQISLDNNTVLVRDFARGVPFGLKEDGSNTLVDIYSKAHTGGKFNNKVYNSVAGLNGIGAKATCLSSIDFRVDSVRDGRKATACFKKGVNYVYKEYEPEANEKNGTTVLFTPDPEVFNLEPIEIDFNKICNTCKNLSYLTKGLTFKLKNLNTGEEVTYCAKNGLLDLINDKAINPIHNYPLYYQMQDGQTQVEIALQWTTGKEKIYIFTNGLENIEGGTSLTGLKTSITRNLNKEFKKNFTGEMARTGLIAAVSCKIPNPSFANQTKTKINNPELRTLVDRAFSECFKIFINKYKDDAKKIKDFLSKEEKAEEAANRARLAVINAQNQINISKKDKIKAPGKLMDCEIHDENSSLYIVEGDSAKGAIGQARDYRNTAILPLRGKIINALKNSEEKVLTNDIVMDLLKALGCGILDKYDVKKLNYGKICIFTDADVDGASIMCLILTFFYKYIPQLLIDKKVYWAQAPLYKIKINDKYYYAYDDKEKNDILKGKSKFEITRAKGIGEMNAEDIRNTVLNDDVSRFKRFTMENTEEAIKMFEMLMGSEVSERKEYIFKNVDFNSLEE